MIEICIESRWINMGRDSKTNAELAAQLLDGSDRALSQALSRVERGGHLGEQLLDMVYARTGNAHVVGITGSPGTGKSTLSRALARQASKEGISVGIIAVDPSSPYSGGSILGDRIRMNDVALDFGVFIRSLATHGALGGLSNAVADSIDLLDAAGRELILVETVGVGQDEVDVMHAAHTVVVVSVPGLGDEIQTLKAGILEIADLHVVNKSDREGAERIVGELCSMLTLESKIEGEWRAPVLRCTATQEWGISELLKEIQSHFAFLRRSGEFDRRRRRMAETRLFTVVRELLSAAARRPDHQCNDLIDGLLCRSISPYQGGRALLTRFTKIQDGEGASV
jgi:LAO/AO transport system kinase